MGRPKKWKNDAERKRTQRSKGRPNTFQLGVNGQNKRTELQTPSKRTGPAFEWQDIDPKIFDGHGNGIVVNGYVRVIRTTRASLDHDYGVVTAEDFWDRYHNYICPYPEHQGSGLLGWTCHECFN